MENKKRNKFSFPAWSASLAIHATGAILILVAGFHIATPEGTVTDKTEFEAVNTNTPAVAAPVPPPPDQPVAAAPAAPVVPEAQEVQQPQANPQPPVDEAPPKPVVDTQPDEDAPPAPTEEAQEVAKADSDAAQDPDGTPAAVQAPAPVTPVESPSEAPPGTAAPAEKPAESPAEVPRAENQVGEDGAVPKYGTPGTTIDETKLMEAFGNHKPDYPWMARLRRQQGTVLLRAFIKKDGSVDQTVVEQSSGFPLIDQEALHTYARWRYQPGLTGWVLKPFKFSLK